MTPQGALLPATRLLAAALGLLALASLPSGAAPRLASDARAEDGAGADPGRRPAVTSGLPLEGGWAFPHYGLTQPPDDRGEPWRLERTGSRLVSGRRLDEVRYVRGGHEGQPLTWAGGHDEVALVDPLTGEPAGGLSGPEAAQPPDPPTGCGEAR